ncbi:hypothetical protein [Phenylobacterium sp.]|uniref:hypothetical protein n=1 Tax=Phenylobacterium sp. TaxID=1871053 RepID=UPI002F4040B1
MAKSKTAQPGTGRGNPALTWNAIRQVHVYLSVFVAPTLIFFAVTGAFQTFRVPDRADAPVVLQKLARAHKDDVFAVKPPKPQTTDGERHRHDGDAPKAKPEPKPATQAVKWFFVVAATGMTLSTLLGVWMALVYHKRRGLMWALLIAGIAIPVALFAAA